MAQVGAPETVISTERVTAAASSSKRLDTSERKPRRRHVGKVHDRRRLLTEHHRALSAEPDASDLYSQYSLFKTDLEEKHGLTVEFLPTIMTQRGTPGGGPASTQVIVSPTVAWKMPETTVGQGTITFNYISNRYYVGGQDGASLQQALNVLDPVNDTPINNRVFNQLTYEHDFPGKIFLMGVGQFSLSNYDSSTYTTSQQLTFISYSTAQNASQTYPTASMGAFLHVAPIADTLDFIVGFQDASNILGNSIKLTTADKGPYTSFAYAHWTPNIPGFGKGQYGLLYYHQPSVPLQPAASDGWSFNASQDIGKNWGVFMRANATTGPLSPIKSSVVGGFVYKDVFGRGNGDEPYDKDQIGIGIARNTTNMDAFVGQDVRASEWVLEAYLNRVIAKAWIFGPDVQIYMRPALNPAQGSVQVYTLRLTGLF